MVRKCTITASRQFLVSVSAYMKVCSDILFYTDGRCKTLCRLSWRVFGLSYTVSHLTTAFVTLIYRQLTISATYQVLSHEWYVMYTKFLRVNPTISLYNTIGKEYAVRCYYQCRKLMPKCTCSSMHYDSWLDRARPHIQDKIATDVIQQWSALYVDSSV